MSFRPTARIWQETSSMSKRLSKKRVSEYIRLGMERLCDNVENGRHILRSGERYSGVCFPLTGTENSCVIKYTGLSTGAKDDMNIVIGVYRNGTDREFSVFDFKGSDSEFVEYVKGSAYSIERYYKDICSLSEACDDYWNDK